MIPPKSTLWAVAHWDELQKLLEVVSGAQNLSMIPISGSEISAVSQGVLTNPPDFNLQNTNRSLAPTSVLGTAGKGNGKMEVKKK